MEEKCLCKRKSEARSIQSSVIIWKEEILEYYGSKIYFEGGAENWLIICDIGWNHIIRRLLGYLKLTLS